MILYTLAINKALPKVKILKQCPDDKTCETFFFSPTCCTYNILNIKLFPNKE